MNFVKRFVLIALLCGLSTFSHGFEMVIFNVGQGNAIIIRHEDKALVVDFGRGLGWKKCTGTVLDAKMTNRSRLAVMVREFLKDVTSCNIVASHMHKDHTDLFSFFKKTIDSLPDLSIEGMLDGDGLDYQGICDFFSTDLLGSDVKIVPIRPYNWEGVPKTSTEAHNRNLVLKIIYAGRSLLLTGDASGDLLNRILPFDDMTDGAGHPITLPTGYDCAAMGDSLWDIDAIVVPHHGSNENGEFAWLSRVATFVKSPKSKAPLLTIISSDPDGKNALPWRSVESIVNLSTGRDGPCFIKPHEVRTTHERTRTKKPIFMTCCAESGCYMVKIIPTQSGDFLGHLALFDGLSSNGDRALYHAYPVMDSRPNSAPEKKFDINRVLFHMNPR